MSMIVPKNSGLTITAPEKALCGLYPQAPAAYPYFCAIDPSNAIPATSVTAENGIATYYYDDLEPGLYHCGASMDGYSALCRMINYQGEALRLDMKLDKLAGNGYEAGYAMLNTQEFIDAQLISHRDAWGSAYAELFHTPQFLREKGRPGRHQQTTNEEMMAFIAKLAATNRNMHIFSLGRSPKYGYDIPLVLFTREDVAGSTLEQAAELIRNNGKPTVQYNAQCHSTEPASSEGALAMMLKLCGDYGERVLEGADVYIIPRINPDGAFEVMRQSPTTGEDMNRDYLRVNNAEIQMVIGAYNLFLPEVAIDGHEKRHSFQITEESICTDMEVQTGAGSLNHPAVMTELAMKMALVALEKGKSLGLRAHFYTKLASAAGGAAGSSYFGTRNSLSFLVETPGQVHLGMFFMERRVLAHYVFASSVIDYTVEHAREVMETVHASRKHMAQKGAVYDEKDRIVLEHEKGVTGSWPVPLIHVPTGRVADPNHTEPYTEHVTALLTRSRPTAYVIPRGLEHEKDILRVTACHGIGHYELPAGSAVMLRQYTQNARGIDLADERKVCFKEGAYVFANTVPSTILNVIMEPDFNSASGRKMTILSMGFINADAEGRLPVYRYCHDLTDGVISVESQ